MTEIHSTAIIEKGAELGEGVIVEPYAVVKKNVILHDRVLIKSHAYIDGHTTIGEGSEIFPSASIGTEPQALKYSGEKTTVQIGKNCKIREFVTINSSLEEGSEVVVGDHCMIMAYCHIAHNSVIGNHVVMSNNATLAGHVQIEDYAIIGGMTPIHQFVRIGGYSFVGGLSRITQDVPPFTIVAGIPPKYGGLNLVGLKRHGFSLDVRRELSKAFRICLRSECSVEDAIKKCKTELKQCPEVEQWIQFFLKTQRGIIRDTGVDTGDVLEQDEELSKALN